MPYQLVCGVAVLFLWAYGPSYPVDSSLLDKLISLFVGQKLYPCPASIRTEAVALLAGCILMNQKTFPEQLLLSLESLTDRCASQLLEMTGGILPLPSDQIASTLPEKVAKTPAVKKGGLASKVRLPSKTPVGAKKESIPVKPIADLSKPKVGINEPFKLAQVANPTPSQVLVADACVAVLMTVCSVQKPKELKNYARLLDQLIALEARDTPYELKTHKYFK